MNRNKKTLDKFSYRGVVFENIKKAERFTLYLALKALEGDDLASRLLDASGKMITDGNGRKYYLI